jgi:hypothetical protein
MKLTKEERQVLLDALLRGPDPEDYDFAPAYEATKRAWQCLYRKVQAEAAVPSSTAEETK